MMPPSAARSHLRRTPYRRSFSKARTVSLVSYEGNKGSSRNPGFRYTGFSETQFVPLLILGNLIYRGDSMRSGLGLCTDAQTTFRCTGFSETRPAPVLCLTHQEMNRLPPQQRQNWP